MLNLADLGSILGVIAGAMTGFGVAREMKPGWVVATIFAVTGLLLGLVIALGISKLSYAALARSCPPHGKPATASTIAYGFLYAITPVISMAVASGATALVTFGILALFR